MPLFNTELNELADRVGRSDWLVYLHTAAPTNGSPANGRTSVGGPGYENGITLASGDITDASNGDIENDVDIEFGTADDDVGTVTHCSVYRGGTPVEWVTLPNTTINSGDTFTINANSLTINGSTS